MGEFQVKKVSIILIMVFITALFFMGCSKSEPDAQKQPTVESSVSNKSDKISAGAQARFEDLKTEYISRAKDAISDYNDKLETLQLKKEGAPEILQKPIEASLKFALEKKDILTEQLTKIENADETNFEKEKTAMSKALLDAEKAYEDLKSQF